MVAQVIRGPLAPLCNPSKKNAALLFWQSRYHANHAQAENAHSTSLVTNKNRIPLSLFVFLTYNIAFAFYILKVNYQEVLKVKSLSISQIINYIIRWSIWPVKRNKPIAVMLNCVSDQQDQSPQQDHLASSNSGIVSLSLSLWRVREKHRCTKRKKICLLPGVVGTS